MRDCGLHGWGQETENKYTSKQRKFKSWSCVPKRFKTTGDTKKALIFSANNIKTGSPDSSGDQCGQLSSSEDLFTGSLVSGTEHRCSQKLSMLLSRKPGAHGVITTDKLLSLPTTVCHICNLYYDNFRKTTFDCFYVKKKSQNFSFDMFGSVQAGFTPTWNKNWLPERSFSWKNVSLWCRCKAFS